MPEPIRQDLDAPFWTLDQAAAHFGITRRSVRRYIHDGLPTYWAGTTEVVIPSEYIAEHLTRRRRQRDTLTRPKP